MERLAAIPRSKSSPSSGLCVFLPRHLQPHALTPRASLLWAPPLWRPYSLSPCAFRWPGSAPCLGVPATSSTPAMLQEVPCCVSLPREFGETGFILLSPGLGTGRCSAEFIGLMGGGRAGHVWADESVRTAVNLPLAAARWGWPCIRVFPPALAPATLPRGGNSSEKPPGGEGRG